MAHTPLPVRWSPRESVVDRFLRYVRIDTQSREDHSERPSSPGQATMTSLLADELRSLGADNVRVGDAAMVYARVPATPGVSLETPVVGFIAHVDTSPAVSGAGVLPVVHRNYQGGDVVLPGNPTEILSVADNPALAGMIGDDLITTDGTTLLGSDDKAGVAAIMTLVDILAGHPDIPHGPVAIAFTTDEEIGVGIDRFDLEAFGARVAYTVDGDALGEIGEETWSADLATITFHGKSVHPGTAKGVMVNAIQALSDFVLRLPPDERPETTEGREGFLHAYAGTVDVERSTLKVILRDFDRHGLEAKARRVREIAAAVEAARPGVRIEIAIKEQYRNMHEVLREHPELTANAMEAARRAGLTPTTRPIRGGTDGSRLTFRGLPCPNLFTGGHNFHSRLEFNSRRGLETTTETLVHLVQIFAERAERS